MRGLLGVATAIAAATAQPQRADACSASACGPGFFTPGNAVTVPANLPAIHWRSANMYEATSSDPAKVTITSTTDPSTPLAFTATRLTNGDHILALAQPLVEGTSYIVTDANECFGTTGPTVTFTAGPSQPLPTSLGTVAAVAADVSRLTVATASGSCSADVFADQASIELTLSPDADPWRDAMLFETLVDGLEWRAQTALNVPTPPGMSWAGRGVDRIFHTCISNDMGASQGVALGMHDVTMRASVPGTTTVLTSTSATIDLNCDELPPDACQADPSMCPDPIGCCSSNRRMPDGWWLLLAIVVLIQRRRSRR